VFVRIHGIPNAWIVSVGCIASEVRIGYDGVLTSNFLHRRFCIRHQTDKAGDRCKLGRMRDRLEISRMPPPRRFPIITSSGQHESLSRILQAISRARQEALSRHPFLRACIQILNGLPIPTPNHIQRVGSAVVQHGFARKRNALVTLHHTLPGHQQPWSAYGRTIKFLDVATSY